MDAYGITEALCPTWIPEDYALERVSVQQGEALWIANATYTAARGGIRVEISKVEGKDVVRTEEIEQGGYTFTSGGKEFYVLPNTISQKAYWQNNTYTLSIRGQIKTEELERMIDSIR